MTGPDGGASSWLSFDWRPLKAAGAARASETLRILIVDDNRDYADGEMIFAAYDEAFQSLAEAGDSAAQTDLGHTLTVFEALLGQIYLVTVVSLIVTSPPA